MTKQHPMIVAMAKAIGEQKLGPAPLMAVVSDKMLVNYARAALTALLEPTPDMVEAGGIRCMMTGAWGYNADDDLRRQFTAMIQHILTGSDASANPQGAGQTTAATTKGES